MKDDDKRRKRRLLCTRDAAARLGRSIAWLARARCYGGGPDYVKGDGRNGGVGYEEEALEAWLDSHWRSGRGR
jgi:hypothetical protein